VNVRGAQGRTPLHRALVEGKGDVARFLIEDAKADPLIVDEMKRTSLHYAALNPSDDKECIELLFEVGQAPEMLPKQTKSDSTPLHFAIDLGHLNIAKYLLCNGADWDTIKDENGKTCAALAKEKKCDKDLIKAKKAASK